MQFKGEKRVNRIMRTDAVICSGLTNIYTIQRVRTQGQEDFLRRNSISLHKIRNCDANKLLSILLQYIEVHPQYIYNRISLRKHIDGIREYFKVLPPPMWQSVLQTIPDDVQQPNQVIIDLRNKEYPYGNGNETPHIHCYPGGAHIKILDRNRIRRYNLVKNNYVVPNIEYIKQRIQISHPDKANIILREVDKIVG